MQKKQLFDMQEDLERYSNVLHVIGFNSAKYYLHLIKSSMLPVLVNERNIERTVIKKAKQFMSFKFDDYQLLDVEFYCRRNKSWFFLEGIQNFRNKKILPLQMVWSAQQNAEYRSTPVWCFLQ